MTWADVPFDRSELVQQRADLVRRYQNGEIKFAEIQDQIRSLDERLAATAPPKKTPAKSRHRGPRPGRSSGRVD